MALRDLAKWQQAGLKSIKVSIDLAKGVVAMVDWKLLQSLGCDIAQGYLIGKSMAAPELPGWIDANLKRLKSLGSKE